MQRLRFRLAITRTQLLQYYQGRTAALSVTTEQGLRLQVALHHFRAFVGHDGLNGRFEIELTEQHRLHRLSRLS
ncbi:DUF2835 family protein [Oceanisphaera psychrotolerans]|uniref:DUF2835 domain-containing protein n=1 Tax=Oceanisphaera psychrotolerans TaxID=1414654 RepID=A0A1J4QCR1_9GAMM|nr:DUF2835 family protein [Oceanisphaera psychrotolerans]OIN04340.1 hypothetical protein BFR47_07005 [Oceanisphaera psychrotolerans]